MQFCLWKLGSQFSSDFVHSVKRIQIQVTAKAGMSVRQWINCIPSSLFMQFYVERLIDRLMVELMVFKIALVEIITAQLKGPGIASDIFRKHLLERLVLYKALPLEHSYILLVCRFTKRAKLPNMTPKPVVFSCSLTRCFVVVSIQQYEVP